MPNYVILYGYEDGGKSVNSASANGYGRNAPCAALTSFASVWDGPNGFCYRIDQHYAGTGGNGRVQLVYPGDAEMGMPGERYTSGSKLYLGAPNALPYGYDTAVSGAILGGFALEIGGTPDTSIGYRCPLLTGTYRNL